MLAASRSGDSPMGTSSSQVHRVDWHLLHLRCNTRSKDGKTAEERGPVVVGHLVRLEERMGRLKQDLWVRGCDDLT
jgi:hypothetical protein